MKVGLREGLHSEQRAGGPGGVVSEAMQEFRIHTMKREKAQCYKPACVTDQGSEMCV